MLPQQKLLAQDAVIEVKTRYATAVDNKDWALCRSCFWDEVFLDYGVVSAAGGSPEQARSADSWVEVLAAKLQRFDVTQHLLGNYRFEWQDEQRLQCISYLTAEHAVFDNPELPLLTDDQHVTVGGYYTDVFECRDGQWRKLRSALSVTWMQGNVLLLA